MTPPLFAPSVLMPPPRMLRGAAPREQRSMGDEAAPHTPSRTPMRSSPSRKGRTSADAYQDLQALLAMQQQQKQAWERMLESHSDRAFEKRRVEGLKRAFDATRIAGASAVAEATGALCTRARFKARWAEWRAAAANFASARRSMLAVVYTLRQLGVRRGLNAWRGMCVERGEQRALLAAALYSLAPEGRAKRAGLNSWKELAEVPLAPSRTLGRLSADLSSPATGP